LPSLKSLDTYKLFTVWWINSRTKVNFKRNRHDFNEDAYLTFKSILNKTLNVF